MMFFDLSSMQPEDIDRAVEAAQDYINKKMQPADLVALVSLATRLSMDQDFTADKAALLKGVGKYNGTEGTGFANGNEGGDSGGTADDASSFTADDSEYNSFEHGPRVVCDSHDCEGAGEGGSAEEHAVLQRRADAAGY